jgi:Do/DeqQ family serine protease
MKNLSWITILVISLTASLGALYIDRNFLRNQESPYTSIAERQKEVLGKYLNDTLSAFRANINFVAAAQRVKDGVVYIRSGYSSTPKGLKDLHQSIPEFEDFFQGPGRKNEATGSGVLLTDDGFIVTNFHVIDEASNIEVILHNKQSYKATVIGSDPTTDLALLKIDAHGLPFVKYGDSDKLQVGEWVLAVGNPFDLTSTVTAGIISGKGRSINILREKSNLAIESFLQTDAAVNPGNSGGALVNLKGDLVGINTAIASPTGSYSGYSFAVPSNLVVKVIQDLKEFGSVQRGLLGVSVVDIDASLARELNLEKIEGVYVRAVNENSAADLAGIKKGDLILKINERSVNSVPELQEAVGRFRPGEKINSLIFRSGKNLEIKIILKNQSGNTRLSRNQGPREIEIPELGAKFSTPEKEKLNAFGLDNGVEITSLSTGKLKDAGLSEGYLIFSMDKKPVSQPEDIRQIYQKAKGGILVEAMTPQGQKVYFALAKP